MILPDLLLILAFSIGDEKNDRELALLIREGDRRAFQLFFERHSAPLISFLLSKGIGKPEADDLLQQSFLTIWENRDQLNPELSVRSFLFTIAYNRMRNSIRDNRHTELQYPYRLAGTDPDPHEMTEQSQAMQVLQQCLEEMPERRRAVFELCYLQEFTYREAAGILGVSPKTIENHMALALKELRKVLEKFLPV